MLKRIVSNREELSDVCGMIPYDIRSEVHPDAIEYPALLAFTAIDGIAYLIIFDMADYYNMQEFIANASPEFKLDGYEYAESEEKSEGADTAVSAEIGDGTQSPSQD